MAGIISMVGIISVAVNSFFADENGIILMRVWRDVAFNKRLLKHR